MIRNRLAVLFVCGFLLLPTGAFAAASDIQLWPSVGFNHGLSERWGAHFVVRGRFDDDVSETKDVLLRPFVTFRAVDNVVLDFGYDYLHSFTSSTEHRIWQAAQYKFLWGELSVSNRIRVDERFVEDVDGVIARFRYRLRTTHPLWSPDWYGVISDEVLANMNDQGSGPPQGFEQNRLRFALGFRIKNRLRIESGYEYQFIRSRGGADTNTHTFLIEVSLDTGRGPLVPWDPR